MGTHAQQRERGSGGLVKTDFEEIGHSGGQVTVFISETDGRLQYAMEFRNDNPVPVKLVSLYALPQGIAVERMTVAGLGVPFPPPTIPGSYLIHLASDREGMFGRRCGTCARYWRSSDAANVGTGYCAYCGITPTTLDLTDRQAHYVQGVCALIAHGIEKGPGGYTWDLNDLATAPSDDSSKEFYLSEERQQTHSVCLACGSGQDVLGRTSYCCACGTRNDRDFLEDDLDDARARARTGALPGALRDSVSALDSFIEGIAKQLVARVPLSKERKAYWSGNRPRHKFRETIERLDQDFGFKIAASLKPAEIDQASKLVARRHLHEHRGGIVDQLYLDETGDNLRLGQKVAETQQEVFSFIGVIGKASSALMAGFHELFPPSESAIATGLKYGKVERAKLARTKNKNQSGDHQPQA